ncbi:MAG: IS110 family transposase [Deefgea sp.]
MEQFRVIGLDLAKSVFQVHIANENGKKIGGRQLKRSELLAWFAQQAPCKVGMEACGGAHEWARRLQDMGFEVKLMAPQYVKPYVQGNKTDARDAAAICEATSREGVPSVAIRTRESQQMQALHRARELWMKQRIGVMNQMRGLLAEFGEALPKGHQKFREAIRAWLSADTLELSVLHELMGDLLEHWNHLDDRIAMLEARIKRMHKDCAASRLIESIPGVGLLTATATIAAYGDCHQYARARQFSCAIGLTPREHSSGGKQVLLGISKRGNGYVRKLLVHGARSVLKVRLNNPLYANDWVVQLAKRRGQNIAVVALAAKNARRIWAMLQTGEWFRADQPQEDALCA